MTLRVAVRKEVEQQVDELEGEIARAIGGLLAGREDAGEQEEIAAEFRERMHALIDREVNDQLQIEGEERARREEREGIAAAGPFPGPHA